jgi:hypothetical protein
MMKMKVFVVFASIYLVTALASLSFGVVITIELGNSNDINPDPYIVDIQRMEILEHSEVELLIQNIEDPMRYKEWELTVFIPQQYSPLTHLDILDYRYGSTVLNIENVPMALDSSPIPGYAAYYADTRETDWFNYGTQPIGAGWGRVDVGNPAWISFHFYVDVPQNTTVFLSVYDVCIPEPMTLSLLSLGALSLLRRKK